MITYYIITIYNGDVDWHIKDNYYVPRHRGSIAKFGEYGEYGRVW